MLALKWIRENVDEVKESIKRRGVDFDLEGFLGLDRKRRDLLRKVEVLKHRQKVLSKKIGKLKKEGGDIFELREETQKLAPQIKNYENRIKKIEKKVEDLLLRIPNRLHPEVPRGKENVEVKRWGNLPGFPFPPRDHQEIGERLGILDFSRAAKMTGSGFVVYRGKGARLERALINFMLDLHLEQGYEEVLPPFLTNYKATLGTGQLPKFEEDLYICERDGFYLVPTAEVPITNLHREEILPRDILPLSYTAYTPCFRREAGSYGKETKGIIRQHQFNKVELVKFTRPEDSYPHLERLLLDAEEVLKRLSLPYRVVKLSARELSFSAAFGYDIEVWLPSQNKWLEISTCSNFEDFQARRAGIKYREKDGKSEYVHTLNGSGLAIGRTVVAILENFQTRQGKVHIPQALLPYMGGIEWLE